jgi:hypothetical protein
MPPKTSQKERPRAEARAVAERQKHGGRAVEASEGVAGEEPGLDRPPGGPSSLFDVCVRILEDKKNDNPLGAVRERLKAAVEVLALRQRTSPRGWDVYVERHISGVRFIVHDPTGREVDLQKVPAEDG